MQGCMAQIICLFYNIMDVINKILGEKEKSLLTWNRLQMKTEKCFKQGFDHPIN